MPDQTRPGQSRPRWSRTPVRGSAVAALLLCAAAPTAAQEPQLAGLDAYVEKAMREWQAPGLAVAVIRDDSVVLARGYGVRELGRPGAVDPNTLFAVASTSKAFTTAALGMLVDEGKLKWDDPATRYLPSFQLSDPYASREVTVRDLVTHRSGLARGDLLWWASPYDRQEVLRRVRHLKPSTSFRSAYGYQNIMFIAAGEVVPAVTGESWDDFVARRIFRPLGMTRSSTSVRALAGQDNVATPHARIDDRVRVISWPNFDNLGGAGSINSSARDMAQWVRLQLGGGSYRGNRLLSPATLREMHAPQTLIRASRQTEELYPETHFRAYGLGWFLQDYRGRKLVLHSGSLDGMRTQVGMLPEEKLGVVVLANMEGSGLPAALMYRIMDAYLGRTPMRDWSADLLAAQEKALREARAKQDSLERARVPGTRPSLPLTRYAGAYTDSLYGGVRIAAENGKLTLRMGSAFMGPLEHWHHDTFRAVWSNPYLGKTFVTFTLDAAGKVGGIELEDVGAFRWTPDPTSGVAAAGSR